MSPWNSGALVSLQERLKNRVWLDTMLIGQLGRAVGGFMDQTEVQNVKLLSGNRERVGLVIDVLRAKGDRDFYAFCKLLQRNEYNDLVNLLEDKASQLKDELEKGMCNYRKEQAPFAWSMPSDRFVYNCCENLFHC